MSKQTDLDLYERIFSKDKQALEILYTRYEKLLYYFAFQIVNDEHGAEEVMHDVFMKLWKGSRKGAYHPGRGKFSSWLLTITRNAAIDLVRKRNVTEVEWNSNDTEEEGEWNVEESLTVKEDHDYLRRAVRRLPADQREVIQLAYMEGASQNEISEKQGIPLGTVKGRIRLALEKLRKYLKEERRNTIE
ncbi:sigma-70 family RNA polymerase sigma factor [Halobacillus sp. HZG1]|uniref:RNA polymerase sigma factor n=1 Tax=Halobacillus sp. HZG1 TaxID=3111769 RepID=UPI002DB625AF|nr:sigma-70 family RNA polymerase sigma factor [Halobacillus sp. HZG1]MEC3885803.1 sigma-70 family RNA polymerase sigma factor [Halobacillus sp. HZG1]